MSLKTRSFSYVHCDVFAPKPFTGNSLAVFPQRGDLTSAQMLSITQELRHFESVFLEPTKDPYRFSARVYDLFEELPFAGHPVIGAACVMHAKQFPEKSGPISWIVDLAGGRSVEVETQRNGEGYRGCLDQGKPKLINTLSSDLRSTFATAFNLGMENLADDLPLEVISTGLEYLVLPVRSGLSNTHITIPDLEQQLEAIGAQFCYLLDVDRFEGRHWNNDGVMEDVATGSAAGVVGAYARRHGLVRNGKTFILKQGHFMGRPSELHVTAYGDCNNVERITVAGAVSIVGTGTLDVVPEIGT